MVAVLFCRTCGSHNVDVNSWINETTAILRCCSCGQETKLTGFTVGRASEGAYLGDAYMDIAQPRKVIT